MSKGGAPLSHRDAFKVLNYLVQLPSYSQEMGVPVMGRVC